tara:strand:- start:229 stop:2550 length:2322 start_codon:yes stop_codon:yes gene_type:complete
MADSQRRLILGNGEQYIRPATKKPNGRSPDPPWTYDEARGRIKDDIEVALRGFHSLSKEKKILEEAVFCMRMHPDFTAKSYSPEAVFGMTPELRSIGSRLYQTPITEIAQTKRIEKRISENESKAEGRMVFVQSSTEGFERFLLQLDQAESTLTPKFREEIQRIERFDTLSREEQFSGFDDNWTKGRVELVIHPSRTTEDRQMEFLFELFDVSGIDHDRSSIRPYPGGPTFVSCLLTRHSLNAIAGTNPLRAAHPLRFGGLNNLRNSPTADAPKPPSSTTKSTIKVGMFDGGIDPTVPLLLGHAEEDVELSIRTPADQDCIAHGTAVAGAILHGALNGTRKKDRLPTPPVYVVSFRSLPTSDPKDVDLYESIDVIERAVPERRDIKVFNISFGPIGPIDDPVSRFTYVLDTLAHTNKVTFCVAVGNDGHISGEERIQAPSDIVHGLGVGAYTLDGTNPIHAYYSCQGPGRECGKVKPDVAAFGGCDNTPIHLVSTSAGLKVLDWGTSFASPLVSRLNAQAIDSFDRSSALLARALLVHTASHPDGKADLFLGHGCIVESIDDIVLCEDQSVTVIFQGEILPSRIVQLPIPWPSAIQIPGKVQIHWTIAALTPIEPMHPGDYTSCCLEETFYPNAKRFEFRPPKDVKAKNKKLHLDNDSDDVTQLLAQRWKQSDWPVSESGNQYKDEEQRRLIDCKWESIVRRAKSKYAKNIHSPLMTLHAIGRNGAKDRFDYAVVITVTANKFEGDLYSEIRNEYSALAPIRLRTEAETRIQI